jgi:hypothetical protein
MRNLAAISLLFLASSAHAAPQDCCVPAEEKARLLQLSFNDFDQDLTHSWRLWSAQGCYDAAIDLLESYLGKNVSTLEYYQKNILTWHAGQLYGFKNDSVNARTRFVASLDPKEAVDSMILWNDYVIGSVAFLDHDLEILKAHRNKIAAGPTLNGKKPNLNIMDSFIARFDQPYGVAYSGGVQPAAPKVCGSSGKP